MVTTLNLSDKEIKRVVESRKFLSELKSTLKKIEYGRASVCEEHECLLSQSGYDDLFDKGLLNAKSIRQEYANCLCKTSCLSLRTRKYVIKIGNLVFMKSYNKIHKK